MSSAAEIPAAPQCRRMAQGSRCAGGHRDPARSRRGPAWRTSPATGWPGRRRRVRWPRARPRLPAGTAPAALRRSRPRAGAPRASTALAHAARSASNCRCSARGSAPSASTVTDAELAIAHDRASHAPGDGTRVARGWQPEAWLDLGGEFVAEIQEPAAGKGCARGAGCTIGREPVVEGVEEPRHGPAVRPSRRPSGLASSCSPGNASSTS